MQAVADETSDPECRSVCAAAAATVRRVADTAAATRQAEADERKVLGEVEVEAVLREALKVRDCDIGLQGGRQEGGRGRTGPQTTRTCVVELLVTFVVSCC